MGSRTETSDTVFRSSSARLPTAFGEFTVTVYRDHDRKENLSLHMGELDGPPPLVRIHSECLTGDVFGSVRCDCGEQLQAAMRCVSAEGRGLILYLRQEGRGIGLDNKIRAYALQDVGMDTVEANLHLGFPADLRSYKHAAAMLKDHGIHSVRLVTNNPEKVKALEACGIRVVERVQYEIQPRPENYAYLQTKASKMGHLMKPWPAPETPSNGSANPRVPAGFFDNDEQRIGARIVAHLGRRLGSDEPGRRREGVPSVTLSFAQSLDGSIAAESGKPLQLSNRESQTLTHELRALHDAILVGINTVLSDDPRLTVRLVEGKNPRPIVLDSCLRLPLGARLLRSGSVQPIIATTIGASVERERRLRDAGADVIRVPSEAGGRVDLGILLGRLYGQGIHSLMVEGGAQVITDFLAGDLVDRMIVTIAPQVVGGLNAVKSLARVPARTRLTNVRHESLAGDLVVYADVEKPVSGTGRAKLRVATVAPASPVVK